MSSPVAARLAEKTVRRLGFGTMRLTGPGIWGPPTNEENALAVLRAAVSAGVQHIDTADAYGPHVAEELICKALHPYADDLLIATKGGFTRHGPGRWVPCGSPAYLRQCVELSLRRLNVEAIDLYYLHRIDPNIPIADQVGELDRMRVEGKIKALGLSKVDVRQVEEAIKTAPIAAIQNAFSISNREALPIIQWCEQNDTAFVAYAPLEAGKRLASSLSTTEALEELLAFSPVVFPIPGTSSVQHLEENLKAGRR
ncbi:MAG: aldo/keto reductase [Pseudomonas sp.]|uniref:aldo/keto reductase n=1 Tax=Pseudomonas sp. TaxID=306 RepID=UPI000CAF3DC5|nr:aldo/keto reductase [Pseudomonas sp.]PJI45908.1 MAG: aldo/keto reductase [Pseudomonas sp.]